MESILLQLFRGHILKVASKKVKVVYRMRSKVLSRKQAWRRTLVQRTEKVKSRSPSFESMGSDMSVEMDDPVFDNEMEEEESSITAESKIQEYRDKILNGAPRKIAFNPVVQVCFVASRKEYGPSLHDLFWHQQDYDGFKQDAVNEIRMYWKLSGTSAKEAIVALYQPEFESELVLNVLQHGMAPSPSQAKLVADDIMPVAGAAAVISIVDQSTGAVVIEGTVMRHVDSLSHLQGRDLEDTDSESTATSGNDQSMSSSSHAKAMDKWRDDRDAWAEDEEGDSMISDAMDFI